MGIIKFSSLGKRTFLISFLLGTLLLVTFWITKAGSIMIIGFYYVIIAAVVNMLIALHELIKYLSNISEIKSSGNAVLLLLVNIPITLIYLFIFFR